MRSALKSLSLAVVVVVAAVGCKSNGPSFAKSWNQETDEKITANPGEDSDSMGESVALVSAQVATRDTLTTLGKRENFDLVLQDAPGVVLVDFFADWCGPCKTQAKILHELEGQAAGTNAQIIKVNIDDHPKLAKKYDVKLLPTLVVMKDGEVVQSKTGLTKRSDIAAMLK